MVDIVDRQSAGHCRLVVTVAVSERSMEADHRQVLRLDLRLESFEGLTRERTFFYLREMPGNLLAGVKHLLAIERSVQKLRRARHHLSGCHD